MASDYEMRLAALKCALEENSRDGWRSIIYKSIQYYRFLADIPDPAVELPKERPINASVGQCTSQNGEQASNVD